jgi:Heterokaryon incompatibility protein (HET)
MIHTWISLLVNGRERTFPKTLMRALPQVRDHGLNDYYWIDAICIDQLDKKERNAQINIMNKIYQRVEAVDVWLGRSCPETAKVKHILRELFGVQEVYEGMDTYLDNT